jgi:hypothetical protein
MTAADPRCAMLSELSECAYRLGVAFGGEAEGAEDAGRRLEYFQLFDRCFFAVRVATALELRLLRAPAVRPELQEAPAGREDLRDRDGRFENEGAEDERPDCDTKPERERDEADRDREAEPASLPVLLRTLDGVAADAAALPGPQPAALPTLRELLAHVTSDAPPPAARAKTPASLRAQLAGSGAAQALALAPPRPSGPGGGLAVRRATGPPRR